MAIWKIRNVTGEIMPTYSIKRFIETWINQRTCRRRWRDWIGWWYRISASIIKSAKPIIRLFFHHLICINMQVLKLARRHWSPTGGNTEPNWNICLHQGRITLWLGERAALQALGHKASGHGEHKLQDMENISFRTWRSFRTLIVKFRTWRT